jgi:flagellar basal-body rod modification protein FlgD
MHAARAEGNDMSTSVIGDSSSIGQSATTSVSSKMKLKTEDFIKMMITQLQHQDPLEPAKNEELLAQMSQIGQLQTSNDLQDMLKALSTQNQIGSAGQLIGKMVAGIDENQTQAVGLVTAVRVQDNQAYLELDTGKTVRLDQVTAIAPATQAA